jgi:hypothetical protein
MDRLGYPPLRFILLVALIAIALLASFGETLPVLPFALFAAALALALEPEREPALTPTSRPRSSARSPPTR